VKLAPHTEHLFERDAARSRGQSSDPRLHRRPSRRSTGLFLASFSHASTQAISPRFRRSTESESPKKVTRISNPPRKKGAISGRLRPNTTARKFAFTESAGGGATPVQMGPKHPIEFQDRRIRPLCHPSACNGAEARRIARPPQFRWRHFAAPGIAPSGKFQWWARE
jgi:hypothetical protein